MPTITEWILIVVVLVLVFVVSRLGDLGDAVGRLFDRGRHHDDDEGG